MKRIFVVECGWAKFVECGGFIDTRKSDDPTCDEFATREEAERWFDEIDLGRMWRVERDCAGRGFDGRGAYKAIEAYAIWRDADGEEYREYDCTVDEAYYWGPEDED